DACAPQPAQCARDRARLWFGPVRLRGPAPALAVIGLSQVRQLEVNSKRAHHEERMPQIHFGQCRIVRDPSALTLFYAQIAKPLDRFEDVQTRLLFNDFSKNSSKVADIAPQRRVFYPRVIAEEFAEMFFLIINTPKWEHDVN